jgi:hypothetical protein
MGYILGFEPLFFIVYIVGRRRGRGTLSIVNLEREPLLSQ